MPRQWQQPSLRCPPESSSSPPPAQAGVDHNRLTQPDNSCQNPTSLVLQTLMDCGRGAKVISPLTWQNYCSIPPQKKLYLSVNVGIHTTLTYVANAHWTLQMYWPLTQYVNNNKWQNYARILIHLGGELNREPRSFYMI